MKPLSLFDVETRCIAEIFALDPRSILRQTIDNLKEVVWWNRYLTKISDPQYFKNFNQIMNELISVKGPYLEKVIPPDMYKDAEGRNIAWSNFAQNYDIHASVKLAVSTVLFAGGDGYLYHHQGEALSNLCRKAILKEQKDIVISVPTATGKTECFLIPILDWCANEHEKTHSNTLKALIVYPMKTLEVDQFNRIIKYLHVINSHFDKQGLAPLRVGIWDGDTPESAVPRPTVDDFVESIPIILPGESARGLECPIHIGTKLVWTREGSVNCEKGCRFPWIMTIREGIRRGVDILITNPEALEYMLLSPKNIKLLGRKPEDRHVKYIVFDEAHMWAGVGGTSLSLLISRLRNFYTKSQPVFVLSSATIPNPSNFASRLLNTPNVKAINYEHRSYSIPDPSLIPQFSEIKPCNFNVLLAALFCIKNTDITVEGIKNKLLSLRIADDAQEISNALGTLVRFGLVRDQNGIYSVLEEGEGILRSLPQDLDLDHFKKPEEEGSRMSEILEIASLQEVWGNILLKKSPELLYIFSLFDKDYVAEETLVEKVTSYFPSKDEKNAGKVLACLLTWARMGGVLYDRYHIFVKPPRELYWCEDDRVISSTDRCSVCRREALHLRFCKKCHEPVIEEWNFRPIRLSNPTIVKGNRFRCNCGTILNERTTKDPYVIYRTFVAWFLSFVTRFMPSRKVLIFSDMRPEAEHIGSITRDLDYYLTADKFLLAKVIELDSAGNPTYQEIWDSLRKDIIYGVYRKKDGPFYVLYQKKKPEIEVTRGRYEHFLYELSQPDNDKRQRLYESSLLSFKVLTNLDTPLKKAIGHILLCSLLFYPKKVQTKTHVMTLEGAEEKQLIKRISSNLFNTVVEYGKDGFLGLVRTVIVQLRDLGVISKEKFEYETLEDRRVLIDYFKIREKDNLLLHVPEIVTYCENCYLGFPTDGLEKCPNCGSSKINIGKRYSRSPTPTGLGYLKNRHETHALYVLDHWGKELLAPAIKYQKDPATVDSIVVAVHRAGLPHELRCGIEEGFRKSPPDVNAISSTPTLELGIDVGTLDCVCLVGMPPSKTEYVQRSGRTGRKRTNPALIWTIVRNDHCIDNFYFDDISERFLNKPISDLRIPEVTASVIKGHIVSSVAQFLNFNSADYQSYYSVMEPDPSTYSGIRFSRIAKEVVIPKFRKFLEDIAKYYPDLSDNIAGIFHPWPITRSLEQIFFEIFRGAATVPPELMIKVDETLVTYDSLIELDNTVQSAFILNYAWLSQWLGMSNYVGNYRGILEQVPLIYSTRTKGEIKLELKSIDQALREAFPGPIIDHLKVGVGALTKHSGFDYYIKEARVVPYPVLETVMICAHEDCEMPYFCYPKDMTHCPLCERPLQKSTVYRYYFGVCRPEFLRYRLETNAISAKNIEWEEKRNE